MAGAQGAGVDGRWLVEHAGDAEALIAMLGERAASWLLKPALRPCAPKLPTAQGSAVVLFAVDERLCGEGSVLAPGVGVPLRWSREAGRGIGAAGEALAEAVRQACGVEPGWRLTLAPEAGALPLEALAPRWGSAFTTLAAALLLAVRGGAPRPGVFASAAWGGEGVERVEALGAKLEAARGLSPSAVVFVPAGNEREAREAGEGIEVVYYPPGERVLERALAQHLDRLDVPPGEGASLEEGLRWANASWRERGARRVYYREHLLRPVAARVAGQEAATPQVRRLVLNLGLTEELAALTLLALRPEEALLLCSERSRALVPKVKALLGELPTRLVPEVFALEQGGAVIERASAWLEQEPEVSARAVEVTGGTSDMSCAAFAAGQRAGARVLYLTHTFEGGAAVYGTERLVHLRW